MRMTLQMGRRLVAALAVVLAWVMTARAFAAASSQVLEREIRSAKIAGNKMGIDPVRKMLVYLPAGYDAAAARRYPVIYFLPNPFEESYRWDFDHRGAQALFDRAIADGLVGKFILVAVDMKTPLGASWYVNSPVTGNWEDFMVQEVVPYVDANFKTLANRDSRGIAGVFIGGYGAIRFGMMHPDVFGTVYAMHPVGTGSAMSATMTLPRWDILEKAKTIDDVKQDGRTVIFLSMFQAELPDVDKPPLFADLPAHLEQGRLVIDAKMLERFRNRYLLERMLGEYADNLNSLRGFKFDWTRLDSTYDHVFANEDFARKLNEFGVKHEAEEYDGVFGDADWGVDGRIYSEVLPFFRKHMVFAAQ